LYLGCQSISANCVTPNSLAIVSRGLVRVMRPHMEWAFYQRGRVDAKRESERRALVRCRTASRPRRGKLVGAEESLRARVGHKLTWKVLEKRCRMGGENQGNPGNGAENAVDHFATPLPASYKAHHAFPAIWGKCGPQNRDRCPTLTPPCEWCRTD
jgi:hypothetical protein